MLLSVWPFDHTGNLQLHEGRHVPTPLLYIHILGYNWIVFPTCASGTHMPQMQFHFCPSLILVEVSAMSWKSLRSDVLSLSHVKTPTYLKAPLSFPKALEISFDTLGSTFYTLVFLGTFGIVWLLFSDWMHNFVSILRSITLALYPTFPFFKVGKMDAFFQEDERISLQVSSLLQSTPQLQGYEFEFRFMHKS